MEGFEQPAVVGQHVLPAVERARGARVAFEGHDDGVEWSGTVDHRLQALGRAVEAVGRLRAVAGDGARFEGSRQHSGQFGAVAHDGARLHRRGSVVARRGRVEDPGEARVAAAVAGLLGLGGDKGAGNDRIEHAGQGSGVGRAHDLHEAGLVDHGHLGSPGEEDLAAAPAEAVAHDVGAERPDVLGSGHGVQGQPAPTAGPALGLGPREGGLHHAGVGDG